MIQQKCTVTRVVPKRTTSVNSFCWNQSYGQEKTKNTQNTGYDFQQKRKGTDRHII